MDEIELPMQVDQVAAILQELARANWEYRQSVGQPLPQGVRPTSRTLSRFEARQPKTPRSRASGFVALLEERIVAEPDPEKRSKLRAALTTGGTALEDLSWRSQRDRCASTRRPRKGPRPPCASISPRN